MDNQSSIRNSVRAASEWLDDHPKFLMGAIYKNFDAIEIVSYSYSEDKEGVKQVLSDARTKGVKFEKEYADNSLDIKLKLPNNLNVRVTFSRESVCTRRVVGTKVVIREVATGWREEEVEEDVVEWDCSPLLSEM